MSASAAHRAASSSGAPLVPSAPRCAAAGTINIAAAQIGTRSRTEWFTGKSFMAPIIQRDPGMIDFPLEKMRFRAVLAPALLSLAAAEPCAAQDPARSLAAHRLETPLVLDGRLDEEIYQTVAPTTGFIQQEPHEGALSSEQTDVWVLFDDEEPLRRRHAAGTASRSARSRPSCGATTATSSRTTTSRSSSTRSTTCATASCSRPIRSARIRDQAIVDERLDERELEHDLGRPHQPLRQAAGPSRWPSRSSRSAIRLPAPQVWGINFRRIIKWKNEIAYLTRDAGRVRHATRCRHVVGGDARRPRNAQAVDEPRAEAVRRRRR